MTHISKFAIRGLYDERDIEIPFDNHIKVLVAENGYGKTTVLNALHGLISGDVSRLRKIAFKRIELGFHDGSEFTFDKSDLASNLSAYEKHGLYDHLKRRIGETAVQKLFDSYLSMPHTDFKRSPIFLQARQKIDIPAVPFFDYLTEMVKTGNDALNLSETRKKLEEIHKKTNFNVLYLPTYRRVEQDLRDIRGIEEDGLVAYDDSINFGMKDVDGRIKEITKEILSSSVEWFSKVNGEMLSQLVEGFQVDETSRTSIKNPDAIKIVLDRIGSNIGLTQKERILQLIASGEIFKGHDPLIYFIANLTKVYEQQKENDKCIQAFTEVCNRYLTDKKLEYNESSVTVKIVRRKNGRDVDIETLSSGEKQIISLFSSLYLKKEGNFAIFFDEPELSLSMEWQKTLLPDIVNSQKCSFLFATTHSPFIFENELSKNTVDLGKYIREL